MQDDYIEDDFLEEENSSSRRPFLIAVGVLVSLFILMGICTAVFLFNNRAAEDRAAEVAAIETRNAETEAANAATAIAATETAAAQPTNTPEPTPAPTDTPAPPTPTPTNTPVVEDGEEGTIIQPEDGEAGDGDGEATDGTSGTDTTGDGEGGTDTAGNGTPTPISAVGEKDAGSGDALPQTGLDTWGIVVAAFVLVGLFIFARRLRTTG